MTLLIDNYVKHSDQELNGDTHEILEIARDLLTDPKNPGSRARLLAAAVVAHCDAGVKTRKRPRHNFDWVALVASKDKTREAIFNRVYALDDYTIAATDGHRLHVGVATKALNTKGESLTPKGDPLKVDVNFPPTDHLISSKEYDNRVLKSDFKWFDLDSNGERILQLEIDGVAMEFNAQYIDDAFNCADSMYCITPKSALDMLCLKSLDGNRLAIVMPRRPSNRK